MYKLLALDLDGTLLLNDGTISKENIDNIKKARDKGVKIVLATGRPIDGIKRFIKQLDLITEEDYTVTYNGALVQNNLTEEVLFEKPLSMKDYRELYDLSKGLKVNIHALTDQIVLTPKMSKYTALEAELNKIEIEEIPVKDLPEDTNIVKIMFIDEPEHLNKVIANIPKNIGEKYTMVQSAPFFFEFLHKEVNKWTGVSALAKRLNIKREEIICVGDAGNDYHMIKNAGLGVAMENAFDEIKECAKYITDTNEEHGVAKVIKEFILDK
ncbi:sugar-phosphatase [Hathewaya histolytica]|uniref:HAD-superfamily hydrolase, subfamily IIB n=1 Tax=Hathewaya histolytica TaxID=1498 RepID=A0A4U9R1D8_HATHI|nr:sugar-phosphatase [Hathewaya histolytica]VTQ84779.1 HAD-superfamily hydrolase, subfamily IIB [Hathewaya histolytica]